MQNSKVKLYKDLTYHKPTLWGTGQELIVENLTKPDLLFKSKNSNLWFIVINFTTCSAIDLKVEEISIEATLDKQVVWLTDLSFIKEEKQSRWHKTVSGESLGVVNCLTGKIGKIQAKHIVDDL
jgi:hypothetical protein